MVWEGNMAKNLLVKCYEQHLQADYIKFEQMMNDYNKMIEHNNLKHISYKRKVDKNGK